MDLLEGGLKTFPGFLKQRSKHGWVKNVIAKSVNSLSITLCSRSLYILLILFSYYYYYYFFLRNVCKL